MRPAVMQGFDTLVLELVRLLACPGESVLIFLPGFKEIQTLHELLLATRRDHLSSDSKREVLAVRRRRAS